MGSAFVCHDLRISLGCPDAGSPPIERAQSILERLSAEICCTWSASAWDYMHGPASLSRVLTAIDRRRAAHVPSTEGGSDDFYGPIGAVVAQVGARRFAFVVEVYATWRGEWFVAIEPRIRTVRFFGWLVSHRIPGSRELDEGTATALSGIVSRLAAACGQAAAIVPGNPHWQRIEMLVFP